MKKKNVMKLVCAVTVASLLTVSFSGCGKKTTDVSGDDAVSEQTEENSTVSEENGDEQKADSTGSEEKNDTEKTEDAKEVIKIDYPFEERFIYGNNNLFYIEDDGSLTCHFKAKDGQRIEYGTGADGYYFFLVSGENSKQELYFLDESFELSYTTIEYPEKMYINCISCYDGKVYYSGYDGDAGKDSIYFYDPHGDAFSEDPGINRLVRYFENYKGRGLKKLVSLYDIVRDLEQTGNIYMQDPDTKDICVFDADTNEINSFKTTAPSGTYQNMYYGPGYLVSEVENDTDTYDQKKEDTDSQEYILYDVKTGEGFSFKIGKDGNPRGVVDIRDDYLYYYESEYKDGVETGRNYKRVSIDDIRSGSFKSEDITFVEQYPDVDSSYGSYSEGNNKYDAFTVKEDRVYFLSYDKDGSAGRRGDVVWESLPLNDPSAKNIQKTGATERHEDFADFGYIEEKTDSRVDKAVDDFTYFFGSYQDFRFYDDYDNAGKINAELEKIDASFRKAGDETAKSAHVDIIENDEEGSGVDWFKEYIGMGYTYTKTFGGVKKVRDHYVQVAYNDYYYYGGAHGNGNSYHYLFDTKTGERKTLKDLYGGTEEEFKDIALKYSMESWKQNGEYYYYEYDGDSKREAEMKEDFANCISLDMGVSFEDDGIRLIYPPYAVGPYASGEIEVWVPYYALGIDL